MEKNKSKFKDKLNVKNINKTFGIIIFVLVFLFTFLAFSNELKPHIVIVASVFGAVAAAVCITWLILFLVFRNKKINSDPNKQKINKALEEIKKKEKQKKYSNSDESNN